MRQSINHCLGLLATYESNLNRILVHSLAENIALPIKNLERVYLRHVFKDYQAREFAVVI